MDRVLADNLFTLSAEPNVILDADWKIKQANHAFVSFFGTSRKGLRNRFFFTLFPEAEREAMAERLIKARYENSYAGYDLVLNDAVGMQRWMEWHIVPMNRKKYIYVTSRDISTDKEREEQLRISYAAMEAAANGIFLLGRDGTISWANYAFLAISGFSREDILGKSPHVMNSGFHDKTFFESLLDTVNSGLVWTGEVINKRPDGSLYTVEETIAPVHNQSGEISHFVVIIQDISERKRTEGLLRENYEALQRDMDLAGKVQESLLPETLPDIHGFTLAARAVPARFVSGDLYDCFMTGPERCFLTVADISGKGVPSAMLASSTKILGRTDAAASDKPGRVLERINRKMFPQLSRAEMFITACAAYLHTKSASLCYASAGHSQGLVIHSLDNRFEQIDATGIPLGILEDASYTEKTLFLAPGDMFILYSDGITEAQNPRQEFFGLERFLYLLEKAGRECRSARSVQELPDGHESMNKSRLCIDLVLAELERFREGAPLADDISMAVLFARERSLSYTYEAKIEKLDMMNHKVREACTPYGEEFAYAMELVSSELLTNIIKHAYHEKKGLIRMELLLTQDRVELDLFDTADPYIEAQLPRSDSTETREGGYGLDIVRGLCDTLLHEQLDPSGNHWHVVKTREKNHA